MRCPYRNISKGVFAPIINLEFWAGGRWVECDAYVDSGATYSIFHTDVATILCLPYQKGRKIIFDHFDYIVTQWDDFMGRKE